MTKYPNLEQLTLKDLVSLHNRLNPESPTKRFPSKKAGLILVEHLMTRTAAAWDPEKLEVGAFTKLPPQKKVKADIPDPEEHKREDHMAPDPMKGRKKLETTDNTPTPPPAPTKRRTRILLTDETVLEQTGDTSKIGKKIHTTINEAFDGKTPMGVVIAKLVKDLDPPRAKGWEEDPVRYVREYVSYNLGQGALRIVG